MLVSEIEMIYQGDFALLHNASLGVVQVSDDRPFRVEKMSSILSQISDLKKSQFQGERSLSVEAYIFNGFT